MRRLRRAYAQQVHLVSEAIGKYFPEGTKVTRPQGGFLLWVEFPKGVSSLELQRQALEQKISVAPGPSSRRERGYRISSASVAATRGLTVSTALLSVGS